MIKNRWLTTSTLIASPLSALASGNSGAAADPLGSLPMLLLFGAVLYFAIIRPQMKKQKEHNQLVDALKVKDEVLTSGGIIGVVKKIDGDTLELTIDSANKTTIKLMKSAISKVLPKGSAS